MRFSVRATALLPILAAALFGPLLAWRRLGPLDFWWGMSLSVATLVILSFAADKSQRWNRVVVKADGWMISAWVNGELVQQVNTAQLPELKHRHLRGWIGLQNHGSKIEFRNIGLRELVEAM